jgi:hypothetical protein
MASSRRGIAEKRKMFHFMVNQDRKKFKRGKKCSVSTCKGEGMLHSGV